ncbi:hypothetical protein ACFLXC_04225 [Chloroflexota bacterium]
MDTSLSKIMIGLFGISGMAIMFIAWLKPMPDSEKIFSTVIGLIGISVATVLSKLLRNKARALTSKVETGDNG